MDGIHDLGGRQGFGAVLRELDEPVFHWRWEAGVFAMVQAAFAAGAIRNVDQFRHAIERIDPVGYLTHGYYGRWLGGIETLLVEAGTIDPDELEARVLERGGDPSASAARPMPGSGRWSASAAVQASAAAGNRRQVATAPRFVVGDEVRAVANGRPGHTRLPAYARGRTGSVTAWHGGWVFPDTHAHGDGDRPQHLYTVSFSGQALWGDSAEPDTMVALDLFESYLEASP